MGSEDSGDTTALDEVQFPHPRDDCVAAVWAAHEFIDTHNGATRAEITDGLVPEENHRIGIAAAQALGKLNAVESYRDWWWDEVILPGLTALPDIQPPRAGSAIWRPTEAADSGAPEDKVRTTSSEPGDQPQSVTDVQTAIDEGYLFELAFRTDTEIKRLLVAYDQKVRPAARPPGSPPAFRFRTVTGSESYEVSLPDLVAIQPVPFEQSPEPLRSEVLRLMAEVAADDPARVPQEDVEAAMAYVRSTEGDPPDELTLALYSLFNREETLELPDEHLFALLARSDSEVGEQLLTELNQLAADSPAVLEPHVSELATLITDSQYAPRAARCLATLAEADPTIILETVPTLATAASSATIQTQQQIVYAFSLLAEEYPEELLPALETLRDLTRSPDQTVQSNVLSALGRITGSYPDAAEPLIEDLVALLDGPHQTIRVNAVGLLADIAQEHPERVITHAGSIVAVLTDESVDARYNATTALLRAGSADPTAVRAHPAKLEAALEDSDPEIRANVCTLIGHANASVSRDRLRDLRDTDPDDRVREQATWALDRLA